LAGFWPSKPTVWLKYGLKLGPGIRFNFKYPRESIGGVKDTFLKDIILLAALAVTKFPKCTGGNNASKGLI
jgi:hypothetical protein